MGDIMGNVILGMLLVGLGVIGIITIVRIIEERYKRHNR
jgi:hypothetical protein